MDLPPADEQLEFLEYVKEGSGVLTAAYALNWTPAKLKKLMGDKEFKEAYQQMMTMQVEAVEEVVLRLAKMGNTRMIELYLYNRSPERWSPPTQKVKIDSKTTHSIELVGSAVEVAKQLVLQQGAIAAIHAGALEANVHDDE